MAAVGCRSGELSECTGLHSQEERSPREEEAWYRFEGSHGVCGCVGVWVSSHGRGDSKDLQMRGESSGRPIFILLLFFLASSLHMTYLTYPRNTHNSDRNSF